MKKLKLSAMAFIAISVTSSISHAGTAFYEATIRKIVTTSSTGLCAAWVQPGPVDQGLEDCNNRWINFDCSGDFGSKSAGSNSFNLVQLAFVTSRPISINVSDLSLVDVGTTQYCLADQVQVTP